MSANSLSVTDLSVEFLTEAGAATVVGATATATGGGVS